MSEAEGIAADLAAAPRVLAPADSAAFHGARAVFPPEEVETWDGLPRAIVPPVRRDAALRRSLAVADVTAALVALLIGGTLTKHGYVWVGLIAAVLIVPMAKMMGRYDRDELVVRKSTLDEFPMILGLAAAFALTWAFMASVAGDRGIDGGLHAGGVWGLTVITLVIARSLARLAIRVAIEPERVLIVGNSRPRQRLALSLQSDPSAQLQIVGFLPIDDERRGRVDHQGDERRKHEWRLDDLGSLARELRADHVFVALSGHDAETTYDVVNRAIAIGAKVSIVPSLLEVVGSAVEFDTVGGMTVLGVRRPGLTHSSRALKRGADVIGASLALLLASPILLIAALLIKLDSPGPVFFRQARVGRRGVEFQIIKFRSMSADAEAKRAGLEMLNETEGLFKLAQDPRITRVGRMLRKSSIDELPQLFNVLRGEMSLVGPRPLIPAEDAQIEGYHRARLTLAPGMTGPWQVLGPMRPPLSEMAKTDYLYAANWSLWGDIKLVVRTFMHVCARRGL